MKVFTRVVQAVLSGILAAFIALLIVSLFNVILPLQLDASGWAGVIGILVAIYVFLTNEP